jgi:zinc transport system substrate-binding protein
MNKRAWLLLGVTITLIFLIFLAFMRVGIPKPRRQPTHPDVVVTIFPVYDIARQIAGDKFEVGLLLPAGASPHTYEPAPSDAKAIADSSMVLAVGGQIDNWVMSLTDESQVTMLDKYVTKLPASEENEEGVTYDPHYWLSTDNALAIGRQITEEFSQLDPKNSDYYFEQYEFFRSEILALQKSMQSATNSLSNRKIATFHNAWQYFAVENNLEIVAVFEEFPGKAPTPLYLANFIDTIKAQLPGAVFTEPQFSDRQLNTLRQAADVNIGILDPIGGLPGRESYQQLMLYNVNELVAKLNHE